MTAILSAVGDTLRLTPRDIYVGLFGRNYGIEDAGPARMNLRPLTTQPPGNEERVSLASNKSNTVPVGTVYRSRP